MNNNTLTIPINSLKREFEVIIQMDIKQVTNEDKTML